MVLAISGLSRGLPTLFCGAFSRSFVAHLNLGQGGNLLSRSLHEGAYDHNPGFKRFIPFRPHPEFKKGDLDARQRLYQQLANPIAASSVTPNTASSARLNRAPRYRPGSAFPCRSADIV